AAALDDADLRPLELAPPADLDAGMASDATPSGATPSDAPASDASASDAPDGSASASADAAPSGSPLAPFRVERPLARERAPVFTHTENVLVLGLDRRGRRRWGRADSILLVVFDPETEHVGVVSIPRDLYVHVPGHGAARINATLNIAERLGLDPLETMRGVVSETLALPIAHLVALDLAAFAQIVDDVGGVEVEVPCAIRDNFIDPEAPGGRRLLDVPAGQVLMDGATAAMYARSRHGRSDWSRARRQQAIVFGVRARLGGGRGLLRATAIVETLDRSIRSDMTRLEMLQLIGRGLEVRADRIHGLVLNHRVVTRHRTTDGKHVLLPDLPAIDAALVGLFAQPAPGTLPARSRCRPIDAALN
ncbi:MAG: LCP family protein, partial [Myxococcales bacterium]|nr:LCP family protein [Myxococcales bacterium]